MFDEKLGRKEKATKIKTVTASVTNTNLFAESAEKKESEMSSVLKQQGKTAIRRELFFFFW